MTSNGVKHHTQMAWISTLCIKVYVPTTYFPWPEKVGRPCYCTYNMGWIICFKFPSREFANFLRSQEQFIQTVKVQDNF